MLLGYRFFSDLAAAIRGRNFELHAIDVLKQIGFELTHCGGSGDKGVDFRGHWDTKSNKVSVIGDCKNMKISCGPNYIRSLIGALDRELDQTVGILVSRTGFTKDAYKAFKSSHLPLMLITINDWNGSKNSRFLRYLDRNSRCLQLTPDVIVASKYCNGVRHFELLHCDEHGNLSFFT